MGKLRNHQNLVLEGTQAEIKAYAKQSSFAWEADDSKTRWWKFLLVALTGIVSKLTKSLKKQISSKCLNLE